MNRHDLLELEPRLRACLHRILPFEAHALYFPNGPQAAEPVWIPEERRLLLPLRTHEVLTGNAESEADDNGVLGVFMVRGMDVARTEALLPDLPALAALVLDNLEQYRISRLDPGTGTAGLVTREVFLERVRQEVARIVAPFQGEDDDQASPGAPNSGQGSGPEACLGVGVVRFPALEGLIRPWGHAFVDALLLRLAEAFAAALPESALTARVGDYAFAVLFPAGNRTTCIEALGTALRALDGVSLSAPHTGRHISVQGYAGFSLYPQDMDGDHLDLGDPAPALLHKAGIAADVASGIATGGSAGSRLLGYGRILAEGGVIRRVLPLSRVQISLGRSEGAREGQSFSVWSTDYPVQNAPHVTPGGTHGGAQDSTAPLQPLFKGEIVILEAREGESVAEILHLGDPSWSMAPGDTLILLPHSAAKAVSESAEQPTDALTGLCRHGDFLARLARAREGAQAFTLAMVHLATPSDDPYRMAQVARLCRELHAEKGFGELLGGRFATDTLIFYHPGPLSDTLSELYTELCSRLAPEYGPLSVGLAPWPFLGLHPGDAVECCRKALEYAQLLPEPHVGVFDTLALNISADKKHCQGDMFGAMEEYKLALLADADNALAWNSLGVCMSSLGRHDEARRHFAEAVARTPEDSSPTYNLGVACLRLADLDAARTHFERCLTLDPAHLFAALRLGQIDERRGDTAAARARFEAAALHSQSALPHRHLARIALREGNTQAAREAVHEALLRDPRDAESLTLMARLYLDGGEDAELAERLARQSLALKPDSKNGWLTLSHALEARGLHREAREALLKSGEM